MRACHARCCSQATKDGITYNINYSTTVYGYNAITVSYSKSCPYLLMSVAVMYQYRTAV